MIVVLGCPSAGRPALGPAEALVPAGPAYEIARAAVEAGATVEFVGTLGDDAAGDAVVLGLARAGIGHAALLRDAGASTPAPEARAGRQPELGRADIELGLSYLIDYRVLVLAEPLAPAAVGAALEAARYQSAQVVAVVQPGSQLDPGDMVGATVLEAPDGDWAAFARMVGRFAAALDAGTPPGPAFATATQATGWEEAG